MYGNMFTYAKNMQHIITLKKSYCVNQVFPTGGPQCLFLRPMRFFRKVTQDTIDEFNTTLKESERLKTSVMLFSNLLGADIKE